MKKTNTSTLKRDLSRYLDQVRRGEVVRIYDRDTPIADIIPLAAREESHEAVMEARLQQLEREGSVIRRGTGRIDPSVLRKKPIKVRGSVVQALIEEPREGR